MHFPSPGVTQFVASRTHTGDFLETVAPATQRKQFVETPGEHNGSGFMYLDEYTAKLREFIDSAESADSGA